MSDRSRRRLAARLKRRLRARGGEDLDMMPPGSPRERARLIWQANGTRGSLDRTIQVAGRGPVQVPCAANILNHSRRPTLQKRDYVN